MSTSGSFTSVANSATETMLEGGSLSALISGTFSAVVYLERDLGISARTAGTSFTILASAPTDTSVIAWEILEPAP